MVYGCFGERLKKERRLLHPLFTNYLENMLTSCARYFIRTYQHITLSSAYLLM